MNDYHKGKIYKIVCHDTGEQYIGSTTMDDVDQRLKVHLTNFQRWKKGKGNFGSVFEIMERDNYGIELVEEYRCENNEELRRRERYWQDKLGCINKYRAYASLEEKVENRKQKNREWLDTMVECSCGIMIRQGLLKKHHKKQIHIEMKYYYENLTPYKWKKRLIERNG